MEVEEEGTKLFYTPVLARVSLDNPVFHKKTFFLLLLQEVALEAPAPLLYKAVWSLLLLFSDVLPRLFPLRSALFYWRRAAEK